MSKINVFLDDVVDELEMVCDEDKNFFNIKTAEFISIQCEHLDIAEELDLITELDRYSKWEREAILDAVKLLEHWNDYIELPSSYDIHEYSIMEDFIDSITDSRKQNLLFSAIQGKKAFRRFKDTLEDVGLEEDWYTYRSAALIKISKEWCEGNNISYRIKS